MKPETRSILARGEERVSISGHAFVVRELPFAVDVEEALKSLDGQYQMLIRCVFEEDGSPAFTAADVDAIKAASATKLRPLVQAVLRVNGLAEGETAKN